MCSVPAAGCLALGEKERERVTPFLVAVIPSRTGHPSAFLGGRREPRAQDTGLRGAAGPRDGGTPTRLTVRPSHNPTLLFSVSPLSLEGQACHCADRPQANVRGQFPVPQLLPAEGPWAWLITHLCLSFLSCHTGHSCLPEGVILRVKE